MRKAEILQGGGHLPLEIHIIVNKCIKIHMHPIIFICSSYKIKYPFLKHWDEFFTSIQKGKKT